ncbi:MAG TPA: hypothetical protein EYQ69_02685 [Gemmatimonadetes bacterium]|nr:hypothetical protein [Gemmatimonadota bacterium]
MDCMAADTPGLMKMSEFIGVLGLHEIDRNDARNSIADNCPDLPSVGSKDLPLEAVLGSECLGLLIYLTPCLKSKKGN